MINKYSLSALLLSVFCFFGTAYAADLNYNQIELVVGKVADDTSGQGAAVEGKFNHLSAGIELGKLLFANLQVKDLDVFNDLNISNGRESLLGFGGHFPVGHNADFVTSIAVIDSSVDTDGVDQADTGIAASAGVRIALNHWFEFDSGLYYVNIFDSETTSLNLGAAYRLSGSGSLVFKASKSDNVTSYSAGIRVNFCSHSCR